jgi:ABC-type sulfate/molybdate transport systems ATPase subunit
MSWRIAVTDRVGGLEIDVDLRGDGRTVALVGPNGSGKTTILRAIAGIRRPRSGRIRVGESVLFDGDAGVERAPEARRIGYVPQGCGLFPHLRVIDNVAFGLAFRPDREGRRSRREAAARLLDDLGCAHLTARLPDALSGGERQRVALARALIVNPQLLLLDEPLSALDASVRRTMRGFLAGRLQELDKPAIVVTHDVRDAIALDAHVYVLESGRVVQQGVVSELRAAPATDFVAEFTGADLP